MGHGEEKYTDTLAKYDKFKWMLESDKHGHGDNHDHSDEHDHPVDFSDFHDNILSQTDKLNFVLLALEKIQHANPAAMTHEDARYLHPSRNGILFQGYILGLKIPSIYMAMKIVLTRNYRILPLGLFFGYTYVALPYLNKVPFFFKENVRMMRGRATARKYLEKQNGELDLFKKILDPRTSHHALHNIKL